MSDDATNSDVLDNDNNDIIKKKMTISWAIMKKTNVCCAHMWERMRESMCVLECVWVTDREQRENKRSEVETLRSLFSVSSRNFPIEMLTQALPYPRLVSQGY